MLDDNRIHILFPQFQASVIEAELIKLTAEQIGTLKDSLNTLFAKCVSMLGHEHHMRVAHSLQVKSFHLFNLK